MLLELTTLLERLHGGFAVFQYLTLRAILGVLTAVPAALFLDRRPGGAEGVIRAVGITQTIPSIALLAFMIPLFGVGVLPAVVALGITSVLAETGQSGFGDRGSRSCSLRDSLRQLPS